MHSDLRNLIIDYMGFQVRVMDPWINDMGFYKTRLTMCYPTLEQVLRSKYRWVKSELACEHNECPLQSFLTKVATNTECWIWIQKSDNAYVMLKWTRDNGEWIIETNNRGLTLKGSAAVTVLDWLRSINAKRPVDCKFIVHEN